ncbi:hypothetical protein QYE76_062641 [Lolium multiflorum]|uniref:Peptidase S8/S53 domain-containing protein n=1 Tax=Lolium multiflorum TaxID=4521 RepID=A0AAD8W5U8_LOLMU|nr:hypothetical protein QYE76_062641 [Lolium multiflorum]
MRRQRHTPGAARRARGGVSRRFSPDVNDTQRFDADIPAAEAAIADGGTSSRPLGGDPRDFLEDAVAIGSLHAVKAGITVVCSAGNNGPDFGTINNLAPWVVTIAAKNTDRASRPTSSSTKLGDIEVWRTAPSSEMRRGKKRCRRWSQVKMEQCVPK